MSQKSVKKRLILKTWTFTLNEWIWSSADFVYRFPYIFGYSKLQDFAARSAVNFSIPNRFQKTNLCKLHILSLVRPYYFYNNWCFTRWKNCSLLENCKLMRIWETMHWFGRDAVPRKRMKSVLGLRLQTPSYLCALIYILRCFSHWDPDWEFVRTFLLFDCLCVWSFLRPLLICSRQYALASVVLQTKRGQ